jgi:hypothetical protein
LHGHQLSLFYYGHKPADTTRKDKHFVQYKETLYIKSIEIEVKGYKQLLSKAGEKTNRRSNKQNEIYAYLTGDHWTTIRKLAISSKAIERNVILSFRTKKII